MRIKEHGVIFFVPCFFSFFGSSDFFLVRLRRVLSDCVRDTVVLDESAAGNEDMARWGVGECTGLVALRLELLPSEDIKEVVAGALGDSESNSLDVVGVRVGVVER